MKSKTNEVSGEIKISVMSVAKLTFKIMLGYKIGKELANVSLSFLEVCAERLGKKADAWAEKKRKEKEEKSDS